MGRSMLVAGPNLTIDRTAALDELRPGTTVRVRHVTVRPGGKGVNVVRIARLLGVRADLVGFVPGRTGAAVAAMLATEGIELRAVPAGGEVRCTWVLIEDAGRVTAINEPGPNITASEWASYRAAVEGGVRAASALVCTGSVPPGTPLTAYADLVGIGRAAGAPTVVDAGGHLLRASLAAGPDLVTPNLEEAEAALDGAGPARGAIADRAVRAAAALVALGARTAAVTAGASGVGVVSATDTRWLASRRAAAVNPYGAGDAFTAAFAAALEERRPIRDGLQWALAASTASVERGLSGELDQARFSDLLRTTRRDSW
jgi:1-phosphofructokinase family hexose kinase